MKPAGVRLCLLACLFFASCAVPQASRGPNSLGEAEIAEAEGPRRASIHLVRQAQSALRGGEIQRARAAAARALRVDQSNPYAYYLMARISVAERAYGAAQRDLEQAEHLFELEGLDGRPWRARLMRVKADIAEANGNIEEAEDLRHRADRLDPPGASPRSGGGLHHVIGTHR
ncbi:MAG: hypothetical protein GY725_02330 [bacterium]|nr:hypothetical protein [bacterium]